jgi:hypothetical protein
MARGRRGRLGVGVVLAAVAVAVVLGLHAVTGTAAAAFLAGVIVGAGGVLAVARPRLSLRVSTRGTRARTLGRGPR